MSDKKKPKDSGQVELSEKHLEDISGGPHFRTFDSGSFDFVGTPNTQQTEAWPSKWKGFSLNGKGNT